MCLTNTSNATIFTPSRLVGCLFLVTKSGLYTMPVLAKGLFIGIGNIVVCTNVMHIQNQYDFYNA